MHMHINVCLVKHAIDHGIDLIWHDPPPCGCEPCDDNSWPIYGVHSVIDNASVCWWYNPSWKPGGVVYYTYGDDA